jgi:hypothetical protein
VPDEHRLPGGNTGGAVRVGDTVPATWSAPPRPWPSWLHSDDALRQVAGWLRDYHTAVANFVPPPSAARREGGTWRPELIIGHNDAAPYNAAWSGGRLVGFFNWDFADPVAREWDLAFTAFAWVPLHARHVVSAGGFTAFAGRPDNAPNQSVLGKVHNMIRMKWPFRPRIVAVPLLVAVAAALLAGADPVAGAAPRTAVAAFTDTRLFFYNATSSAASTGMIDAAGTYHQLHSWPAGWFTRGWTHVVPTSGGRIFFYNTNNGAAGLGYLDSANQFHNLRGWPAGWFTAGWTQVVPTADGRLFFYNANNSSAAAGDLDAANEFHNQNSWPAGWFSAGWTGLVANR